MRTARIAPALLLAALLLPAHAAALHALPVRVSLDEGLAVQAPLPYAIHALEDVQDVLDGQALPAPQAPAGPPAQAAADAQAPAPAASALPLWVLPALTALALLLVLTLGAALLVRRGRRKAREEAAELRAKLELARMCADASVSRAIHLAETNGRLRAAPPGREP